MNLGREGTEMADRIRDRKDAEEARYKLNEEQRFKIRARRNKLFGAWVAGHLRLEGDKATAYALDVVQRALGFRDDQALIAHVASELAAAGVAADAVVLQAELRQAEAEATRQITAAHPHALDTDHRKVGD
jgi:hypothetical protein